MMRGTTNKCDFPSSMAWLLTRDYPRNHLYPESSSLRADAIPMTVSVEFADLCRNESI